MADTTVGSIKIQAILDSKPALRGLSLLDKRLKGLKKPVNNVNKIFGKLFKIAGFAGFTKMAIDAGKFGRAMGLLADKTGIAASKISSMRNSFAAMGGSAKSIDNLLNNLSTGLARLSMGDGTLAATLSAMNINAWDENGRLKKSDRLQGEIANWANQQKALGRSFAEVAVFLKDNFNIEEDLAKQMYTLGQGGMEAQRKRIEEQTGKLSGGEISNLQKLNVAFSTLTVTIQVLLQKIVAGLSPIIDFSIQIFNMIFKGLQELWNEAVDVFKIIFGEGDELGELLGFLKFAFKDIIDLCKVLIQFFGYLVAMIKFVGEIFGKLAAWIAEKFGFKTERQEKIDELGERVRSGKISREEAARELEKITGKNIITGDTRDYEIVYIEGGLEKAETVDYEQPVAPVYMEQTITVNKDGTVNAETASSGDINFLTDKLILNEEGGAL